MDKDHAATRLVLNGLAGVLLSLAMWKITDNFWGWLALFTPGSLLILYGGWMIFRS